MRLETLILELAADTTNFDRVTNQAIDKIAAKLSKLENRQINIKAPLGELLALDRELIQKQKDYMDTVNLINRNPINIKVDYSQVAAARNELKALRSDLGGNGINSTIRVQVEHQYKVDIRESNRDIANEIKGLNSGLKEVVNAVNSTKPGIVENAMGAVGAIASVPAGIIRGVGAGIAQNATRQFGKGFESALNDVFKDAIGSLEVLGDSFGKASGTNAKSAMTGLEKARKELNRKIAKSMFEDEVDMVQKAMQDKNSGLNLSEAEFNQYAEKAAAKYIGKEYIPSFNVQGFQKVRKELNSKIAKSMFEDEISVVRNAIDDKSNPFTMSEAEYKAYADKVAAKYAGMQAIPDIALPTIDPNKRKRAQSVGAIAKERDYHQTRRDIEEGIKAKAKSDIRDLNAIGDRVAMAEQAVEETKTAANKEVLKYLEEIKKVEKKIAGKQKILDSVNLLGDAWGEATGLGSQINDLESQRSELVGKKDAANAIAMQESPALARLKKLENAQKQKTAQSLKLLKAQLKKQEQIDQVISALGIDVSQDQIPEILSNAKLAKGSTYAEYSGLTNQVFLSPETVKNLYSGKLNQKQFGQVAHEFAHGSDFGFGSDRGMAAWMNNQPLKGKPLNITDAEFKSKLGSQNGENLKEFLGNYAPERRKMELSAEVQGRRATIKHFGLEAAIPSVKAEIVPAAKDTGKQIGHAIVHALGQGAIATVKGSVGALGQGIGAAQGLEKFVLDVIPYGHGAKKLTQAGMVLGGLPMAAAAFPALAPVAGMMHGIGSLGAAGGSALAGAHLGGVAGIPMIGGQVAGLLSGAAGGTAGIAAELLTATAGVKLVTKTIEAVVTKVTGSKEASDKFKSNLQLAEVQAAAIASELKKVSEGFKSVTGQMKANPQLAGTVNRSAQIAQAQLKGAMAQLPASERMGDEPLAKELQAKLSMLERLRKSSEKIFKQQGGNPKDLTIDITATAVEVQKHWDHTEKSVAKNITDLSKVSAIASYEIQHNLAEGSPGLTQRIRDYWDKTTDHIKDNINSLNGMRLGNFDPAEAESIGAQSYTHMADATEALDRLEAKLFGTNRIRAALDMLDGGMQKVFSEVSKVWDILGRSPIGAFVGSLGKAAVSALGLFAIFKAGQFIFNNIGKAAFETARNVETLTRALNLTTNGKATETLSNIKKQADELGTSYLGAAQAYKQFSGSTQGTELEDRSSKIFGQLQRGMSARGMSTEEQKNAMLALSQIASKGVVSMEELRGQLSEAFPGALQIAARAVGKTVPELNKLVESGQLLSTDFLGKFGNQIEQESSGSNNTADAAINRMNSQMERLQTNLGEPMLKAAKIGLPVVSALLGVMADNGSAVSLAVAALSLALTGSLVSGLVKAGQGLGFLDARLTTAELLMQKTKQAAIGLGGALVGLAAKTALIFAAFKIGEGIYNTFISENEDLKQSFADVTAEIKKFNAERDKPKKGGDSIDRSFTLNPFSMFDPNRIGLGRTSAQIQAMRQYGGGIFGEGKTGNALDKYGDQIGATTKFYGDPTANREQILAIRSRIKDSQLNANLALGEGDTKGNLSAIALTNKLKKQEEELIATLYPDISINRAILKDLQARKNDLLTKKDLLSPADYNRSMDEIDQQAGIVVKRLSEYDQVIEEVTVEFQKMTTVSSQLANKLSNNEFIRQEAGKDSSFAGKQAALKSGLAVTSPALMEAQLRIQQQQIDKASLTQTRQLAGYVNNNLLGNLTPELNKRLSDKRLFGGDFGNDLTSGKISGEALSQVAGRKDLTSDLQGILQLAQQYLTVRTQIKDTEAQILDADIAIAQQQYNRAKEARDFRRSEVDLAISIRDTLQGQQRQAEDMAISIQDFKINAAREVRNFTESYQEFGRSLDRQLLEAQQQLETSKRNLSQQSLSNSIRGGLASGGDSLLKGFLDLVDSQIQIENKSADNKKALNLQALDIEQQRLEIAKQIRSIAEQAFDLERSRFNQLLSMARAQEDYVKQQQSAWLSVTRQVEDMKSRASEMGFKWKGITDIVSMMGTTLRGAYGQFRGMVGSFTGTVSAKGGAVINMGTQQGAAPLSFSPKTQFNEVAVNALLKKYGSPMKASDFLFAQGKSGVSADALVAQAMIESGFGTKGRGATYKNPLNYGNDDAGNNRGFATFREGLVAAAMGLKKNFNFSSPEEFAARNFQGKYGRYATDPNYLEKYIKAVNRVRDTMASVTNAGITSDPSQIRYAPASKRAETTAESMARQLGLAPIPSINTGALQSKANKITQARTAQLNVDRQLSAQEEARSLIDQSDRIASFSQSIGDMGRQSERQMASTLQSVKDLVLGAKGYLNAEEAINKAVSDRRKQYSDQVQSLSDANRAIDKQVISNERLAEQAQSQLATVKSAEQREQLEAALLKIERLSGQLTKEKRANEQYIVRLKESELVAAEAVTKEQQKQLAIARQSYLESSSNSLLDAQIGATTNPFEKQQLQMQANASKTQQQLQKTLRDLNDPEFQARNGLTANDVANEIGKAEKLAAISLQTLNDQSDVVLGGMTQAFSGFFDGIFGSAAQGFNNIGDLLANLGKSILNTIGNIFSQMAMESLMPMIRGLSGGISGGLGGLFGFAMGSDSVPNYAGGIDYAMQKERAMSGGRQPYMAVLHQGESVLSTLNRDAQTYRALKASGGWEHLKAGNPIRNYANGTQGGYHSRSSYNSMGGNSQVINQNITVVTPNADSFRKSQAQINADQAAAMRRTMKR